MTKIKPIKAYQAYKELQQAIKTLPKNPSTEDYRKIKEMASFVKELAQKEINTNLGKSSFNQNIDKILTHTFEKFASFFNKVGGHNCKDFGKTIVQGVLYGNIFKDLMTGIVSSSQSFTNPDYSKDKKLFMGSYDVMACMTTVLLSFILGPLSLNKINNGYRKLLQPLANTPKYNLVLNGLSAATTIILQSIIAKRVFAPALSTPLAGIMKKQLDKNSVSKTTEIL